MNKRALNKLFYNHLIKILFLLFGLCSCSYGNKKIYNTEILCPDGSKILVKFVRLQELKKAIEKADLKKRKEEGRDQHSAIILDDGRSFMIEKRKPEYLVRCALRESEFGVHDKDYVKKFNELDSK